MLVHSSFLRAYPFLSSPCSVRFQAALIFRLHGRNSGKAEPPPTALVSRSALPPFRDQLVPGCALVKGDDENGRLKKKLMNNKSKMHVEGARAESGKLKSNCAWCNPELRLLSVSGGASHGICEMHFRQVLNGTYVNPTVSAIPTGFGFGRFK